MTLPAPLAGLAPYRQFVAVRLAPDPARPGKTNKFPINPRTMAPASSTDPTTWGSYDEAAASGLPVGFVLTESDPFFCVDIDGAITHPLVEAFPGAAVELSQSGNGLHIWGYASHVPPHACKRTDLGIELYHTDRFICLGTPIGGNAWLDFTPHLERVVAEWFPPRAGAGVGAEWTDAPRADWRGSTDDADLIRRARESRSAGAIFGGKACFDDLWLANEAVLAASYPSTSSDPWGKSEADRALAQHLAFWTGCDCARMLRLMRQSALVRDKWEREDYLERTILSAVADCRDVCRDKAPTVQELAPQPAATAAEVTHVMPTPQQRTGVAYVTLDQYPTLFAGCVYVLSQNKVFVPGQSELVTPDAFRVLFGGIQYAKDETGEKWEADAWRAFTQCPLHRPPTAKGVTFRPDLPHGALVNSQGDALVNTYKAALVQSVPGDVTPFLTHLAKLLPDEGDRAKLLSYMAAIVQYPGKKFAWAPLVQGVEGNGKSLLNDVVREAVGHKYSFSPNKKQLEKEFNLWMASNIFIYVEDVLIRRDLLEDLKTAITGTSRAVEGKGVNAEARDICCNFIFNCNPKGGVPKTANDRRIAPFYTAQQEVAHLARDGMVGDYFPRLWDWLRAGGYGHVTHFLRTYAIPDQYNPATLCQRAPSTTSTAEAIEESFGPVEQEVLEAVAEGRQGFRGGWISSHFLDVLLQEKRKELALTKRRDMLATLGYVPHPGLVGGRVNNTINPDNRKPRLYVKPGSLPAALEGARVIAAAYSEAQTLMDDEK
jgi:hypothetical protein